MGKRHVRKFGNGSGGFMEGEKGRTRGAYAFRFSR